MNWYHWILLVSLGISLAFSAVQIIRFLGLAAPGDYAPGNSRTGRAVTYSFTGAMSPGKKESAFLHLPTYISGMIYHLGTFLAFGLSLFIIPGISFPGILNMIVTGFLAVSASCGIAILVKRIIHRGLKELSVPDDYISNILVTVFQVLTAFALLIHGIIPLWYIVMAVLLIYIPVGKLKHLFYYFPARYYLGRYLGKRGVWPPAIVPPE